MIFFMFVLFYFCVWCLYKLVFIFDIVCIRFLIYYFFNIYEEVLIFIIRVEKFLRFVYSFKLYYIGY